MEALLRFILFIIASILVIYFVWNDMFFPVLIICILTFAFHFFIDYMFKDKKRED